MKYELGTSALQIISKNINYEPSLPTYSTYLVNARLPQMQHNLVVRTKFKSIHMANIFHTSIIIDRNNDDRVVL